MKNVKDAPFDKHKRKKKILLRNTLSIYIAYYIPLLSSFGAMYVGLTNTSPMNIIYIIFLTTIVTTVFIILILIKKNITPRYSFFIHNGQYLGWIIIYFLWIINLNNARTIGLMFAIMAMVYLLSNSSFIESLIMTVATVILHIFSSYYAITYMGAEGELKTDIFYTCCFIPTSLFISYLAGQFKAHRKDVRYAKRNAENALEQLWGEMELAKKIQTVLLPKKINMHGYEIDAFMKPAKQVGGDYYDIINVADKDWLVIGDVSGHGVPAGLIMMMVQTAIHVTVKNNPDLSPSELLHRINATIYENITELEEDKYMTITVLAAYSEGKFCFSGLHQDILIYRSKTEEVESVETNGIWLGIADPIKHMLDDSSFVMNDGDVCLLYTDGITEARNKDEIFYGQDRLKNTLQRNGTLAPHEIKDAILMDMDKFIPRDDITMVILKKL